MRTAARAVVAAALLALAACATTVAPGQWKEVRKQPLPPFEMHEACVAMRPGDRLEYSFVAEAPVKFDIHFHEGKAVIAPVTRDRVAAEDGVFDPLDAHDYCMTWESGVPGTLIDYRYRYLPGGAKKR